MIIPATSVYLKKHLTYINNLYENKEVNLKEKYNYIKNIDNYIKNNKIKKKNYFPLKNINKKITIILPVYNIIKYINLFKKSILSIINQTHLKWELIIIDDCSTDGTYEFTVNFLKKINRNNIKLLKNIKNKGCYVSMNIGIQNSSGSYITRLDADDEFHINKLKIQINILENNPSFICTYCSYKKKHRMRKCAEITCMYRKSIFKNIGYFDSVRFAADSEFKDRIYKSYTKNKISIIEDILYYANFRPNSLTTAISTGLYSNVGKEKRKKYRKKYLKWHNKNKKLYLEYPLLKRKF